MRDSRRSVPEMNYIENLFRVALEALAPDVCSVGLVSSYERRHYFVAAEGLYFDGEHPRGVKRLRDLFADDLRPISS